MYLFLKEILNNLYTCILAFSTKLCYRDASRLFSISNFNWSAIYQQILIEKKLFSWIYKVFRENFKFYKKKVWAFIYLSAGVMLSRTHNLGPVGSAFLTFFLHKQTCFVPFSFGCWDIVSVSVISRYLHVKMTMANLQWYLSL